MEILKHYFSERQDALKNVVGAFLQTPYGIAHSIAVPQTYKEFTALPRFSSDILKINNQFVVGEEKNLMRFVTSGSMGEKKEVFVPVKSNPEDIPEVVKEKLQKNPLTRVVGVRSRRHKPEFAYWNYERIYRSHCPKFNVHEFSDQKSAVDAASAGDILVLYDYPSSINHFLFYLEQYVADHDRKIFRKDVVVETFGEPITIDELNQIRSRTHAIFGNGPTIWVSYAMTEVGGIGIYEHIVSNEELLYRISDDVFVEILDAQGKPVERGKVGEIVVTPLRTKGTILLRYRSQDKGAFVFKNKTFYLKVLGRDPKSTTVFVAGGHFLISDLLTILKLRFPVVPKMNVRRVRKDHKGIEVLRIELYFPENTSQEMRSSIETMIQEWIIEEAKIQSEVQEQRVKFSIKIYTGDILPLKAFQLF